MLACSFGFRPRRVARTMPCRCSSMSAGGVAGGWSRRTSPTASRRFRMTELMQAVEERVCDQSVLKLLRAMLRAGVMEDGQVRRPVTGTPQGGVVSPCSCNVYLHRLDRAWDDAATGCWSVTPTIVVVMCWSRSQAEAALARLTELLAELGLEPKAAKTRIVHLEVGGGGLRLPRLPPPAGAHRGGATGSDRSTFLARWPADKAMQHARDRIRELTDRRRLLLPVEAIVEEVNRFLRGWAAYFRYGQLGPALQQDQALRADAAGAVRRQAAPAQPSVRLVGAAFASSERARPDQPCTESSSHPGRSSPGGKDRMPAVNDVGEPCAGEPHARFEGRELETERRTWPRPPGWDNRPGNRRNRRPRALPPGHATAPAPDPPSPRCWSW